MIYPNSAPRGLCSPVPLILAALPATLALASCCSAVCGADIVLKTRATSGGSIVLLGDVAEITGDSKEAVATLKRLELFPAPYPGKTRLLRRKHLREIFVLHGIDPLAHRFQGARYLRIDPPQPEMEPPRVAAPSPPPDESFVLTAARSLTKGSVLSLQDVQLVRVSQLERDPPRTAATAETQVVGQELLRPLTAGQLVDQRYLRRPLLVRRGDEVTVVAKSAGVRVTSRARAMGDGTLGQVVRLQTLEGRQQLSARVTGLRSAEVFASGFTVSDPRPLQPVPQGPRVTNRSRRELTTDRGADR